MTWVNMDTIVTSRQGQSLPWMEPLTGLRYEPCS